MCIIQSESLFNVENEVVVVTGAMGQLGTVYTQLFLECGAKVAALDLSYAERHDSFKEKYDDKYLFVEGSVTSKADISAASIRISERLGFPTVLINNAALDSPPSSPPEENGPFEEYPESSWDKVVDVNLKGVYLCCQVFGAAMAKEKKGSIINVASIYGMVSPDQGIYQYRRDRGEVFYKPVAYSASKSGIYNLTRYLASYWGRDGVRVNSLTIAGVFNNQDQEFLDNYCERIPIGRMANPDEYNGSMLFLASQSSSYMTGANLVIDGGWTAI